MIFERRVRLRESSMDARNELRRHNTFLETRLGLPIVVGGLFREVEAIRKPPELEAAERVHRIRMTYATTDRKVRVLEIFTDQNETPQSFVGESSIKSSGVVDLTGMPLIVGVSFAFVNGDRGTGGFRLGFLGFNNGVNSAGLVAAEVLLDLSTLGFSLRRLVKGETGREQEIEAGRLAVDVAKRLRG
ncbi:hypothetical protein HZC08_02415 [Candidatus Micrarchaeota archaeon]|nr:hypothetical protein [Candidatus Micrarchaeota archaeon]